MQHATVWTCGPQGVLTDADLLVRDGAIVAVGRGLKAPAGATIVDGTGKHVAPGTVDVTVIGARPRLAGHLDAMRAAAMAGGDIPTLQMLVFVFALTFVLLTLFADLLNGWLDPRVRLG